MSTNRKNVRTILNAARYLTDDQDYDLSDTLETLTDIDRHRNAPSFDRPQDWN